MGIRVDAKSLKEQLEKSSCSTITEYHKNILEDKCVYSIGGGIGQSRVMLFLLEKENIWEVQADTEFNNKKSQ
ncbi:asparagine synthetase A (asnA) [Trachipleistophora hominis]|uniref:Asparagine synthetase A (AsnA) n=1 Tax=Trachipleistophora hominis TaxID=72359 RepID=L7JTW5_TRAHO|nr:asparagine synthetase A (asnA) [Trachipleistophora hominis]